MLKQRVVRLVVLGALSVLLVAGCNEDQIERMLGRDAAQSIERTYDVIDDPALSSWVSYVGNTIVAVSTRQHIPYTFKVVDSDMVNAFAAPWGHVYVMRGLTEFAEDEDEVWGVLGHEVAHVVHRDIIKAVKRTLLWSIGASVVASKSRTAGDILGLGLGLLSFHYSRDDGREADDAGVTYAYLAGHDPRGIIAFFDRLQKKYEKNKPTKLEALLSTHPLTSARIARLKERPELNPKNGDALVRIARGYIRRGRALEGLRLAQQAAQVKPEQAEPHLVAAEAALKRGYLSVALTELRRGRELLGYVPAIDRRVNQVASLQPRQWKPWSKEEADQVATLLAQAPQVRTTMQQRQDAVRESQQSLSARVKPLTNRSRALMAELSSLAETDRELTDRLQSALLKGNAVVAQASELVSALETIADGATRITAESNALPALLDRASSLAPCDGPPGTASWLGRSYRAAQTALDDVAEAMSLAGVAVPEAEQALQSSADAVTYMTRLMAVGENDLLLDSLRAATDLATKHASAAKVSLKEAKMRAARAEVRVSIAAVNLASLGATPEEMDAIAQIIAYFAGTAPSRVIKLMEEHRIGPGEAAACLIAARSTHGSADQLAKMGAERGDFVQFLERGKDCLLGSQILLRFMAQAVAKELPTASHEPPQFTS